MVRHGWSPPVTQSSYWHHNGTGIYMGRQGKRMGTRRATLAWAIRQAKEIDAEVVKRKKIHALRTAAPGMLQLLKDILAYRDTHGGWGDLPVG